MLFAAAHHSPLCTCLTPYFSPTRLTSPQHASLLPNMPHFSPIRLTSPQQAQGIARVSAVQLQQYGLSVLLLPLDTNNDADRDDDTNNNSAPNTHHTITPKRQHIPWLLCTEATTPDMAPPVLLDDIMKCKGWLVEGPLGALVEEPLDEGVEGPLDVGVAPVQNDDDDDNMGPSLASLHMHDSPSTQSAAPPTQTPPTQAAPPIQAEPLLSVAGIALGHPGAALYPLEVEHNPHCVTAAALVPLNMMQGEEEEEEEEEEGEGEDGEGEGEGEEEGEGKRGEERGRGRGRIITKDRQMMVTVV